MKTATELGLLAFFFLILNFGFSYSQINGQEEFNEVIPRVVSNYTTALERYRSHPSKDNRDELDKMRDIIFNKTGFAGYKLLGLIKEVFQNVSNDKLSHPNCTNCESFPNFAVKYQKKLDEDADNGFYGLLYEGTNETVKNLVRDYQHQLDKFIKEKSDKNRFELENQYNIVISAIGHEKFDHHRRFKAWVDDNKKHIFSAGGFVSPITELQTTKHPVTTVASPVKSSEDLVIADALEQFLKAKHDCEYLNRDCDVILTLGLSSANSRLSLRKTSSSGAAAASATGLYVLIGSAMFYKIKF